MPDSAGRYFSPIEFLQKIVITRFGSTVRTIYVYKFGRLDAQALYEMAEHKPFGFPRTYPD